MTDKYKALATLVENGHSNYDDRLWKLLKGFDLEDAHIDDYDYSKLFPYFILSGATIESLVGHGDEISAFMLGVKIDEAKEEDFYRRLLNYLGEIQYGMRTY